jgi:hypothetical protein
MPEQKVKRIKIPEKCIDCRFSHSQIAYCYLYEERFYLNRNEDKPNFCKAIAVTIEEKEDER